MSAKTWHQNISASVRNIHNPSDASWEDIEKHVMGSRQRPFKPHLQLEGFGFVQFLAEETTDFSCFLRTILNIVFCCVFSEVRNNKSIQINKYIYIYLYTLKYIYVFTYIYIYINRVSHETETKNIKKQPQQIPSQNLPRIQGDK